MLKNCLFLFLVLLMKPVFAASLMSHEKFVHLSYEEQQKIVVSTMELIVEMEEKYKHQVKTSGFDPERFRRYTDFMKKVSNLLFFPAAHAAVRNVRYGQYLNQLKTILNQRNNCIYGGWASEMVNNLCVHPSNSKFRNIYQADNNCSGIGKISCNPAIFGFKNVGQKSLFCVPAGRAGSASDNTSRECMNKALYSNESGASSREERIQNMIAGIAANPADANAVFDFLLKACACDSRSPEISQHYQTYMRPHRTCFSLLKMMSEVMPQCTVNPALMDSNQLSFLQHIQTTVSEAEIRSTNVNNIDAIYRTAVVGNGSADSGFVSRPDYRAICGGNPPVPAPSCADALKLSTGVCCEAPNTPNAARTACEPAGGIQIGGGGDGEEACTPPAVRAAPGAPCLAPSAGGGGGGDTTACVPATNIRNAQGVCEPPPVTGGETGPCVPATNVRNAQGVCEPPQAACVPATNVRNAEGVCGPPPALTCEEDEEIIAEACVPKCATGTPPRDTTTNECSNECTDRTKEVINNACVTKCAEGVTRNTAGVCGGEPSGHTIEVKSTIKDLTSTTITVKVDGGSTLIPGHTIIWFKKGTNITSITFTGTNGTAPTTTETPYTPVADLPETTAEESDPPATETPPENTTWDDAGTNETPIPTSADDMEFTAPRSTANYEVCARLVKVSDRSLAATSCATVQQRSQQSAPQMNPGQQQMGPTRGGSSDAIFRGIR